MDSAFDFSKSLAQDDALTYEETLPIDATSLTLTKRQLCDLELILNGGFAPLTSFMGKDDYESVLHNSRLASGVLWPMTIMLDVTRQMADSLIPNEKIILRDEEGLPLAIFTVKETWEANKKAEAQVVFNTQDEKHPGVFYLFHHTQDIYLGGELTQIALPHHYDFKHLRQTPNELKAWFKKNNWQKIIAFQTRNPMHRAHQELTLRAQFKTGANLLIHPVVGMTKPGDIEYYTRVRCYEHVMKTYAPNTVCLSLLPLAMRMGGPKEALWHAIIRKNYGCTHFIVGRDHAGPGKNSQQENFYPPYAAQELALQHQAEIGIEIVPFQEMVYSKQQKAYFPIDQFPKEEVPASISGTELRESLQKNRDIPEWFSYPEIIDELRKVYPLKHKQGLTLFFTGLPSSGKSTLANALAIKLKELTNRQITFLDGDVIRTHLSKGLGFSREDREINITRVGYVAKEITKHGGIAICALIAPFASARMQVREMIEEVGGFFEIYVSTSLSVCERRDRKGLYKKAREGLIKQFTGINDPYEEPNSAEINLDTAKLMPDKAVDEIITTLQQAGFLTQI